MKVKIHNFTSWYNDIALIPTILISLPNAVRYLDIDITWLIFYVGVRFEKPSEALEAMEEFAAQSSATDKLIITEEMRKELDNAYLKGFETGKYASTAIIEKQEELIAAMSITITYFRKYSGESERISKHMAVIDEKRAELQALKDKRK